MDISNKFKLRITMKAFKLEKCKKDLLFIPLGGTNEIGMNLYVYFYEGKLLIIDMGIGFPDERHPGVNVLVPDISFLIQNKALIAGLVVTHAHEDHIGAIQYIWHELNCPIYATPFTAAVIKAKFADMNIDAPKLEELDCSNRFCIGPFELEAIYITHSIPEMHGIALHTSAGTIFHTGDWKLDNAPVVGNHTDEKRLKRLGDDGVLAVVGDSTNIFNPGRSGSEGELQESLLNIIGGIKKKLIVITTFASNLARLHSIATAAHASGRKVALVGRSLWRIHNAAKDAGYLDDLPPFISEHTIKKHKRDELLIIATGCQGEPLAAMTKMAHNVHKNINLHKGDVVIFSSKIIPGNEKKIFALFNALVLNGVDIMTERDHLVHVSGHPSRMEISMLYEWLRPKIVIPMHGEPAHLHEHAKFARALGIQSVEPHNGSVIKISDIGAEHIGSVNSGYMAIDGNFIMPVNSPVLKARQRMRDGAIIVTLIGLKDKLCKISIATPGCLDENDDADLISELIGRIEQAYYGQRVDSIMQESARKIITKFARDEMAKAPMIAVNIVRL